MALSYNQPRFSQSLLSKYKKCSPSFTINLYDDHWTLNKGPSKFLYTQPVSGLLDEVRALRIPVDFIEIFEAAHVPYYEGCMIVESIDHRKPRSLLQQSSPNEPECVRVVLQPTAESLYADLCLLSTKNGSVWTDLEALEIESKILNATCPPLCLDPDVNLTRIVNTVIRASTPSDTVLMKRKQVHEPEEDENDKAKRAKLWSQYMHPHNGKPSSQTQHKRSIFDILNEVAQKDENGVYALKWKQKSEVASLEAQGQPQSNHTFAPPNAVTSATGPLPSTSQDDSKSKSKLKVTKKPDVMETQAALSKGKSKPTSNPSLPTTVPSPAPEQRKAAPNAPGVSRTPVDTTTVTTGSPNLPVQFQQQPPPSVSPHPPAFPANVSQGVHSNLTKKKGVLKKPEEQTTQPPSQQPLPVNPMEVWQSGMPPAQYLSQPPVGKKKQSTQPQQTSPFHTHTPVPGFPNGSGFPQNAGYKNTGGVVQNPNIRGSPMAHNQPLLSRDPLPPHSQSPHPSPQPAQQVPSAQHHHFNMHNQNRFNPALQGQPGHHPHSIPQHPNPQQHHGQPAAPRVTQGQHDQAQAMHQQMQMRMPYNGVTAFSYQQMQMQMQMQGMMNGARMPPGMAAATQAVGGQYMHGPGWQVPTGRGGPMTTIPMHSAQQQQHILAAMNRAPAQQAQSQGQGR